MNSKRLNFILIGVIGLLFIGLLAGTYQANKLFAGRAIELSKLKARSLALDQQKIGLQKAKKDIQAYSSLEKIAKTIVPEDKSQAEAVREIVNIAATYDISLSSINFPASTLGAGTVSKTGASSPTPAPVSGSGKNTKSLSQLVPVKSITGVYQLQITINSDVNKPIKFDKMISFLNDLEKNRRTAQVSTISLQPDPINPTNLTFNLTLNEYIKP